MIENKSSHDPAPSLAEKCGAESPAIPIVDHRIRLRGPWEVSADGGRTRHARRFGRPRTLDAGERLWLVCTRVPGPADVLLNGTALATLPAAGPFAADVTDAMLARNEVTFVVASAELLGEVSLEVRARGA
jgi:hypothetical protein